MEKSMVTIQDQRGSPDIGLIERLLAERPGWGRSRLSVKLCELWDWRADNGVVPANVRDPLTAG
jgi:hypothetical protein